MDLNDLPIWPQFGKWDPRMPYPLGYTIIHAILAGPIDSEENINSCIDSMELQMINIALGRGFSPDAD